MKSPSRLFCQRRRCVGVNGLPASYEVKPLVMECASRRAKVGKAALNFGEVAA